MSKKLIIFYKSKCLEPIHKELIKTKKTNKKEVQRYLKVRAITEQKFEELTIEQKIQVLEYSEKSCKDMTDDELNELAVTCFKYSIEIGLKGINFPDNECSFIREL